MQNINVSCVCRAMPFHSSVSVVHKAVSYLLAEKERRNRGVGWLNRPTSVLWLTPIRISLSDGMLPILRRRNSGSSIRSSGQLKESALQSQNTKKRRYISLLCFMNSAITSIGSITSPSKWTTHLSVSKQKQSNQSLSSLCPRCV